jgi:hypothetical protein
MKDLEQENRKLRNLVAGLTLDLTLEGQTPKRLLTSAEVVD